MNRKLSIVIVLALMAVGLLVLGNVHLVTGPGIPIPKIVKKDSFHFNETVIHLDRLTGKSWEEASQVYPLSIETLVRNKLIWMDKKAEPAPAPR